MVCSVVEFYAVVLCAAVVNTVMQAAQIFQKFWSHLSFPATRKVTWNKLITADRTHIRRRSTKFSRHDDLAEDMHTQLR
jgi:hypothetical protein